MLLVQIGQGLPSAKLETEVNSRIAPIARTRRAFFTVLLLDEVELPCYSASGVTLPCVDCELFCFSESVNFWFLHRRLKISKAGL
jgi:hypothetical protein